MCCELVDEYVKGGRRERRRKPSTEKRGIKRVVVNICGRDGLKGAQNSYVWGQNNEGGKAQKG